MINVKEPPYNAVGNGVADDTAAIQAAIDACRASIPHGVVYLPPGTYKITAPLWLTGSPASDVGQQTMRFVGADSSNATSSSLTRTVIDAISITDRPALVIQGCRDVHLSDFLLIGANNITLDNSNYTSIDPANYQYPGLRVSRYSPHCGICVDPSIGSTTPPNGGYSGFTYLNTTGASSRITLQNVTISKFIVGLMLTPTDGSYSYLVDCVQLSYCNISNCDIGVSTGQSQARELTITGGNIGACRICVSGLTHGKQQGSPPKIYGTQIGVSGSVFHFGSSYGSSLLLSGCYIESVNNLGSYGYGTNASQSPGKMIGCDIKLGYPEQYDPPGITPYVLELGAPFEFDACVFSINQEDGVTGLLYNVVGGDSGEVKFRNCSFSGEAVADAAKHPLVGVNRNLFAPYATFDNCQFQMTSGAIYGRFMDFWPRSWGATGVPARIPMQPSMRQMYHLSHQYAYKPGLPNNVLTTLVANTYNVDANAGTVSFTIPSGSSAGIIQDGDIIGWRMLNPWYGERGFGNQYYIIPALRVSSVTPSGGNDQVVCAMLMGPSFYDSTYAPAVVEIYPREWALRPDITCQASGNNSTTINVTAGTSVNFRVGDWMKAASTTYIPANARVTAINTGADQLTLNKATTGGSFSGLDIYWGSWATLV